MPFPRNLSLLSLRSKAFGEFGITVVSRNYNIHVLLNRPKAFDWVALKENHSTLSP